MADSPEKPDIQDEAQNPSAAAPRNPEQTQQPQPEGTQQQLNVDDTNITAHYANFCRVSSTPEELILDLGLNPHPFGPPNVTIKVGQRIILNHFTAKRLLSALSVALQRHEQAFGVLETDVRKRVRQQSTQ